jgi:hypothetical protein
VLESRYGPGPIPLSVYPPALALRADNTNWYYAPLCTLGPPDRGVARGFGRCDHAAPRWVGHKSIPYLVCSHEPVSGLPASLPRLGPGPYVTFVARSRQRCDHVAPGGRGYTSQQSQLRTTPRTRSAGILRVAPFGFPLTGAAFALPRSRRHRTGPMRYSLNFVEQEFSEVHYLGDAQRIQRYI